MSIRSCGFALVLAVAPAVGFAQTAPVAAAFKNNEAEMAKNLVAAAKLMPADKYGFKPTPAQMSFGEIVLHLAGGNDVLCGAIGGAKAPAHAKVTAADGKEKLVAALETSFKFCDGVAAKLDDSKLSEALELFGTKMSRAAAIVGAAGDWADHYSQSAIYLRLNGLLPPTAKK
ncbi:MAG: DinB family protein [Gemmatimonadaceae bacterium]